MATEHVNYICVNTGGYNNCSNSCTNTGGYTNTYSCTQTGGYTNTYNCTQTGGPPVFSCTNTTSYNNSYSYYCTDTAYTQCSNYSCYNCGNSGCNDQNNYCSGQCSSGTVGHSEYINSQVAAYSDVKYTNCVNVLSYSDCTNSCSNYGNYSDQPNTCSDYTNYSNQPNTCSNVANYSDCTNSCTNYNNYNNYSDHSYYCNQGSHKFYGQCEDTATYKEYANTAKNSCYQKYDATYTGYTNATGFSATTVSGNAWGRAISDSLPSWNVASQAKIAKSVFDELQDKLDAINQKAKRPVSIARVDLSNNAKFDNSQFDALKANFTAISNAVKLNGPFVSTFNPAANVGSVTQGAKNTAGDVTQLHDEIQILARTAYYANYFNCSDSSQFN